MVTIRLMGDRQVSLSIIIAIIGLYRKLGRHKIQVDVDGEHVEYFASRPGHLLAIKQDFTKNPA